MCLQFYTGCNVQEDKNSSDDLKAALVGAINDWNNVLLYTEYQDEPTKSVSAAKTDDNLLPVAVRYNF
ncbi:hypothetical protein AAOGI_44960 [Agarivorans albus]